MHLRQRASFMLKPSMWMMGVVFLCIIWRCSLVSALDSNLDNLQARDSSPDLCLETLIPCPLFLRELSTSAEKQSCLVKPATAGPQRPKNPILLPPPFTLLRYIFLCQDHSHCSSQPQQLLCQPRRRRSVSTPGRPTRWNGQTMPQHLQVATFKLQPGLCLGILYITAQAGMW